MPQIMAEAFARGLVDKIMIEVLDVIDPETQNGKSWRHQVHEGKSNEQLEFARGTPWHEEDTQVLEHTHVNYSKTEEMELIAKLVRDLHEIQIGDSRYVLPPSLLALEKQLEQVKCATCNIDGEILVNSSNTIETRTTQGQGDTHHVIHTSKLESSVEPRELAVTIRTEEEGKVADEAINVSVGLLHQMIEEIEDKTFATSSESDVCLHSTSKERIAIWEEKEERFIRIIESNELKLAETLQDRESINQYDFHNVELKKSCLRQHAASTSRDNCLEFQEPDQEFQIIKRDSSLLPSSKLLNVTMTMDSTLTMDDAGIRKASNDTMRRKKRGFGGRLRRLFRAIFGRRKN